MARCGPNDAASIQWTEFLVRELGRSSVLVYHAQWPAALLYSRIERLLQTELQWVNAEAALHADSRVDPRRFLAVVQLYVSAHRYCALRSRGNGAMATADAARARAAYTRALREADDLAALHASAALSAVVEVAVEGVDCATSASGSALAARAPPSPRDCVAGSGGACTPYTLTRTSGDGAAGRHCAEAVAADKTAESWRRLRRVCREMCENADAAAAGDGELEAAWPPLVVFYDPLVGPDKSRADSLLAVVAARCRTDGLHCLVVTSSPAFAARPLRAFKRCSVILSHRGLLAAGSDLPGRSLGLPSLPQWNKTVANAFWLADRHRSALFAALSAGATVVLELGGRGIIGWGARCPALLPDVRLPPNGIGGVVPMYELDGSKGGVARGCGGEEVSPLVYHHLPIGGLAALVVEYATSTRLWTADWLPPWQLLLTVWTRALGEWRLQRAKACVLYDPTRAELAQVMLEARSLADAGAAVDVYSSGAIALAFARERRASSLHG